jgi:DNA invertase Pin-like site-specific DNA recombinase
VRAWTAGPQHQDLLNVLDAVSKVALGSDRWRNASTDTTTPHGRLMLAVLGGLAEFERELIDREPMKGVSVPKFAA